MPLFVRAGSIVPLGQPIEWTRVVEAAPIIRRAMERIEAVLFCLSGLRVKPLSGGQARWRDRFCEAARAIEFPESVSACWNDPDQAVVSLVERRRIAYPTPPKPSIISAQVPASGTPAAKAWNSDIA